MSDRVEESLERARQAVETARVDHEIAGDRRAALDRLYYACFHAARAVLYDQGYDASNHRRVLSLVDRELVHGGNLPREQSQTFRTLFVERQDADYGFGQVSANVERLLSRAEEFVETMAEFLDEPDEDEDVDTADA